MVEFLLGVGFVSILYVGYVVFNNYNDLKMTISDKNNKISELLEYSENLEKQLEGYREMDLLSKEDYKSRIDGQKKFNDGLTSILNFDGEVFNVVSKK